MDNIKAMKRYNIFKNLEEKDVSAMVRCLSARVVNINKGTVFINKGDKINYLYIILSGIASDRLLDENGNYISLCQYKENDIIGLQTYTSGKLTFQQDFIALSDLKALAVNAFRLINPCQNFCPRHANVMKNTINALGKHSLQNESHIKELTKKTTREKLLSYLYNIVQETKKTSFTIPYTHQELATYLGVERSALSLELVKLKKEGIIDYQGKNYSIL